MTRINWNPSARTIRQFGYVFLLGFLLLGGLAHWRSYARLSLFLWALAATVGSWAILLPGFAVWPYRLWMGLGWLLGQVSSRIVLVLIFYGIFSPVALVFRCLGRDALALRKPKRETYWVDHPEVREPSSYDHLF